MKNVRPTELGFEVQTSAGALRTDHIVVATGNLNVPNWPDLAKRFPASILQIDGTAYRNAAALPAGAILVIGCGNTGGQIAEELVREGRQVFLSTGRNGRVPRTYRGRDIFLWLTDNGRIGKPRATQSGRGLIGATHTISLQSLSDHGVVLLGRLSDCSPNGLVSFDDTLAESATYGDEMSTTLREEIDDYIDHEALDVAEAQPDPAETVGSRFPDPPIREIDLSSGGITTVLWAAGLRGDFSWLKVPGALDSNGQPVQKGCISVPRVYFAGLDTLASLRAGTVLAANDDASRIARQIAAGLP